MADLELTVRPTADVDLLAGPSIPARRWEGTTKDGVKVTLWVAMVRVDGAADQEPFRRALLELLPLPKAGEGGER